MPPDDALLTADEVCDLFKIHKRTLTRWVNDGKLPAVTLPSGRVRYRQADVDAILATADQPKAKTA